MPIFLCRWQNGDVSIVSARNKDDAIVALDEFDNADHAEISELKEQFLADFRLTDDGPASQLSHARLERNEWTRTSNISLGSVHG